MARMTKEQIKQSALSAISQAEGYDSDELDQLRTESLDYYYNRPNIAPSAPGRSSLQSSDVADMLEAVIAQVMPAFENDNIASFIPNSEEDIDQARMESDAVSYVIMQQSNGHHELQSAVRSACLMRNGVMKCYLDEQIDVDVQHLERLTELEYGQLLSQSVESLNDVDNGHTLVETAQEQGFHDVRLTVKRTNRKVMSKAIDPTNFSWEREHDSIYLDDCRFVAERSLPSRSDLIEMGYSKRIVNALKAGANNTGLNNQSRNQNTQTVNYDGETPAEDLIETYECYMRLDADNDGLAELLKIVIADDTLLEVEEAPYIPYCSGTPFLQPHRFNGLGLFDKLRHVQDGKTTILRQLIDNQNHANNSRVIAVDGMVNLDDVTNSRPGGVVRATTTDAITPFPFNDIGPSCQATLDYLDKVRSERGGASLDLQSAQMQIAGDTAHGVERQMASKEQLAELITRTIAETLLKSLYILTHQALRLYIPDELTFFVRGQVQSANPAQWPERKSVSIKSGLSLASRMRKKAALEGVMMKQDAMKQAGEYVSPDDSYNAQIDWCRVQGIDDPERYFTDPSSEEAQQARAQQAQQAQAQKEEQDRLFDAQMYIEERKADNNDAKIIEDQRQFDEELNFKYAEANLKQETEEAKMITDTAFKIAGGTDVDENGPGAGGS
jgi:hypothetical protein